MLITKLARFIKFKSIVAKRNARYKLLKSQAKWGYFVRTVQGSKMKLDLNDEGISKDLAVDGIREPESTMAIRDFVKRGDAVVDIGANLGYYTLLESKIIGSKGRVYAIEPSPSNADALKENIKLNGYTNIECYTIGIGDKKGTAKMFMSPHSNLNSLVLQKNKRITGSIEIQITTLDDFLKGKKQPDFIRMDVEGYEYNIIKGMKGILKSRMPLKVFIELHPHIISKDKTCFILKTLMENGFEIKRMFRCFTMPEMKIKSRKDYDYSSRKIADVIKDDSIISGSKGAFEIFFERK